MILASVMLAVNPLLESKFRPFRVSPVSDGIRHCYRRCMVRVLVYNTLNRQNEDNSDIDQLWHMLFYIYLDPLLGHSGMSCWIYTVV